MTENVLIYARDPRDPLKQAVAASLLLTLTDGALLWQVACEYIAAARKLVSLGFDLNQAWADIADMRRAWTRLYSEDFDNSAAATGLEIVNPF